MLEANLADVLIDIAAAQLGCGNRRPTNRRTGDVEKDVTGTDFSSREGLVGCLIDVGHVVKT